MTLFPNHHPVVDGEQYELITNPGRELSSPCLFSEGQLWTCQETLVALLDGCGQLGSSDGSTKLHALGLDPGYTTLGKIMTLAHRLGMRWELFDPDHGILTAAGNGHLIVGTLDHDAVRLHYRRIGPHSITEMCAPTEVADKFGFGILSGDSALNIPDFKVGTIGDVLKSVQFLDPTGASVKPIMDVRNFFKWGVTFGFSDLVALICPSALLWGSHINRARMPSRYCAMNNWASRSDSGRPTLPTP